MDVSYALHSLELEDKRTQAKKKCGKVKINTAASFENVQDVYYEHRSTARYSKSALPSERYRKNNTTEMKLIGKKSINDFLSQCRRTEAFLRQYKNGEALRIRDKLKNRRFGIFIFHFGKIAIRCPGQSGKIIGSIRDITDRKLYQNQLIADAKSSKHRHIAGGIAHDLTISSYYSPSLPCWKIEGNKEKTSKSTQLLLKAVKSRRKRLSVRFWPLHGKRSIDEPMRIPDLIRELVAMLKRRFRKW